MATIIKRGKRWYAQIRRKGFGSQGRTFESHADARAWAIVQEARIEQGEPSSVGDTLRILRLTDIIDRYIKEVTTGKRSHETEKARLVKLQRDPVATVPLIDLSAVHIADYRDRRLATVRAGTVRRELSLIHHALDVARKEWGIRLPNNPVADVRQPKLNNARDRRLADGELDRLLGALDDTRNSMIKPIVLLAIETGMRRGELLNLTWRYVRLRDRVAHIPQTKTGMPRTIPLTDQALAILKRLPSSEGKVFPLTANAFKLAWVRVVKRSHLIDLRFHDLRHEAISRFAEMGLTTVELAVISGHRDPRMLFRYTHLRPHELAMKLAGRSWAADRAALP